MRGDAFGMITIILATVALFACAANEPPPETTDQASPAPGTITVHMNGRMEVDIGAGMHAR
ncbi:MAG TPA: hypothetical protein VGC09_05850 [Rhodopila sp.]